MQSPPPPAPNLEPPGTTAEVRPAHPADVQRFTRTLGEIVRDAGKFLEKHEEGSYEIDKGLRESQKLADRLRDATRRLNQEAGQPAEDRREQPRRSRPHRHR